MGGNAPQKEFLQAGKGKEDQEVLAWHSCSSRDLAVPKEHRAPYLETPLLMVSLHEIALEVGKYDLCFQGSTIICLQKAAEEYIVSLMEDSQTSAPYMQKG